MYGWVIHEINSWFTKMNSVFVDKNELLHVGISPGIFLLFCMAVCYTRLLSLGMAVCDYASPVTLIQPIQNATFFGKNVPKIIFAIMGGSKYSSPFSTSIFRTRCAIPAFRGPLWESWAPFQGRLCFGLSTACFLDVSSRNGWINVIEIGPKVYVR
jgi:hypothetical protein